jgi:hypothetical protein
MYLLWCHCFGCGVFCPLVNPKSFSEREREKKKKKKKKKNTIKLLLGDKIDLQKSGSDHPPDDLKLLIFLV